jgi:hypothetical protein
MYEYGTLKPAEVILKRERRKRKNNGDDEPNGVYCMYIWKCQMKLPVQLL